MKFTIHKDLSRTKLVHVLPEPFASQVPRTLAEPITSIFFPNKVVTGRVAAKALSRVAGIPCSTLVLAARDFTAEARKAASAAGAILLRTSSDAIFWSDDRLVEIRTMIATHRPLHAPTKTNEPGNA
ncbi:MAG: hypothetical protein WCF18_24225 [Chthoniobacteraceae bacterium]